MTAAGASCFLRRMAERPLILITNDDGIEAPGLRALERPLAALGEVWVVAPSRERSTSSHSMSLMAPVRIVPAGRRRFSVSGTPADSVFVALFGLLPRPPAIVVSGINRGPNLGTDVIYSGTVAAAREAAMRGVPAIAVSLTEGSGWALAARTAARVGAAFLDHGQPPRTSDGRGLLANVNVPPGGRRIRLTRLGARRYPEKVEMRRIGRRETYAWFGLGPIHGERSSGTDTGAVARGDVSVTLLAIDQTMPGAREAFRDLVAKLER